LLFGGKLQAFNKPPLERTEFFISLGISFDDDDDDEDSVEHSQLKETITYLLTKDTQNKHSQIICFN
jgi:hypothetical protein